MADVTVAPPATTEDAATVPAPTPVPPTKKKKRATKTVPGGKRPMTGGKSPRASGKTIRRKDDKVRASSDAAKKSPRKPHRFRPGTVALRQIRKYQKSTEFLIPKLSFERVVRETAQEFKDDVRFSKHALANLQAAAEAYLTDLNKEAMTTCCDFGLKTLTTKGLQTVLRIRKAGSMRD